MPVGMTVEIPGMTTAIYQQVMANMNWSGEELPAGFVAHYACEKPDGLFVFDVWESAEDWQRFAEGRLGAAIAAATGGQGPAPEPRFFPLVGEEHRQLIEFRPLEDRDLPLVEEWLRRDHVAEWWRDPLEVADEMRRAAATGERLVDYYAIVVDGRPAGVIQTYLVADHPEGDELVRVGPDAAGVDLFMGEPDLVGRGIGPEVLRVFVREVVFARPETTAAVATVEEANSRSWRAFEKAGFRHVRDVEEDGLPHRLMRLDRPA